MRTRLIVMLVILILCIPTTYTSATEYLVKREVVGAGMTRCGSSVLRLRGTLGQDLIGQASTFSYVVSGGFWYSIRTDSSATTGIGDGVSRTPVVHRLAQNYPNPVLSFTHLGFDLPAREQVSLDVFDVAGRRVATLVDDLLEPGTYVVELRVGDWANGVYFYRLATPTFSAVRKLLLLR